MLTRPIIAIAPGTWLISDYKLANMYLMEGEEKALLIDTGSGLGPLKEDVESLTKKPLIVALTHGHGDHTGGCHLLPVPSLIHPADMELKGQFGTMMGADMHEFRVQYVKSRGKVRNPEADEKELLDLICEDGSAACEPLADGQIIDLGGRFIEVIHTPGHSPGSVCFLDKRERLLFTGDTANDCLLLNMWPHTTSVKTYHDGIARLWERRDEYDAICLGHDSLEPADKTILLDYLTATENLLRGEQGQEADDGLHSGLGYYYNRIRIFYDPEHLI